MIYKPTYLRKNLTVVIIFLTAFKANSQQTDTVKNSNWSAHFQMTVIGQKHSGFNTTYSGSNSLSDTVEPTATSITSTLFLGRKLWKGAAVYINPELSGGRGLSYSVGVAGAFNGETYRIGDPAPVLSIARGYLQQFIPLGARNTNQYLPDDVNQVSAIVPNNRLVISVGKFSMSDFFDKNSYSHDPRVQFLNWSLMSNGAWDYPANTKGYTMGIVLEWINPDWSIRVASVAVPKIANQPELEYVYGKAQSETVEIEKKIVIHKRSGILRLLGSYNLSRAPSYKEALSYLQNGDSSLFYVMSGKAIINKYGGKKLALCLNIEQEITNTLGVFARLGYNDGRYASWAFTEIDQTVNAGFSLKGYQWQRKDDIIGVAYGINGISADHQAYLKKGGDGFIIGDGKLNYGKESILEAYYNAKILQFLRLSFDYQLVRNPGYNKDRSGPVHVFALRGQIAL